MTSRWSPIISRSPRGWCFLEPWQPQNFPQFVPWRFGVLDYFGYLPRSRMLTRTQQPSPHESPPRRPGQPMVRYLRAAARVAAVIWILCGLLVCTETMPDVIGHAHAHSQGHPMEPWTGDETSPAPSPENHFHYHVVHDFSSVEVDILGVIAPAAPAENARVPVRCEEQSAPDAPCLEMLEPPLV
jgi:hypothetical protein